MSDCKNCPSKKIPFYSLNYDISKNTKTLKRYVSYYYDYQYYRFIFSYY